MVQAKTTEKQNLNKNRKGRPKPGKVKRLVKRGQQSQEEKKV